MSENLLFLERQGIDHAGRTLPQIWNFNDLEIENTHDFIQWVFPLNEASGRISAAQPLDRWEVKVIIVSDLARESLCISAEWFLKFLKRNNHWIVHYNHNHLRISRILKSLVLLGLSETAKEFHCELIQHLDKNQSKIDRKALDIWRSSLAE